MTRQELERLASEKPQKLALLFAQKVAGIKNAIIEVRGDQSYVCFQPIAERGRLNDNQEFGLLPDYLTDWTAVINAGKKAGIEWWKNMINDIDEEYIASPHRYYSLSSKRCVQQSNWPDCAALMIVMIEVMEVQNENLQRNRSSSTTRN